MFDMSLLSLGSLPPSFSLSPSLPPPGDSLSKTKARAELDFTPHSQGLHKYVLYFMCDAFMGWDQEYHFEIRVHEEAMAEDRNLFATFDSTHDKL